MKLCNIGHNFDYETEKLLRLFFPFEKIQNAFNLIKKYGDDSSNATTIEKYIENLKIKMSDRI